MKRPSRPGPIGGLATVGETVLRVDSDTDTEPLSAPGPAVRNPSFLGERPPFEGAPPSPKSPFSPPSIFSPISLSPELAKSRDKSFLKRHEEIITRFRKHFKDKGFSDTTNIETSLTDLLRLGSYVAHLKIKFQESEYKRKGGDEKQSEDSFNYMNAIIAVDKIALRKAINVVSAMDKDSEYFAYLKGHGGELDFSRIESKKNRQSFYNDYPCFRLAKQIQARAYNSAKPQEMSEYQMGLLLKKGKLDDHTIDKYFLPGGKMPLEEFEFFDTPMGLDAVLHIVRMGQYYYTQAPAADKKTLKRIDGVRKRLGLGRISYIAGESATNDLFLAIVNDNEKSALIAIAKGANIEHAKKIKISNDDLDIDAFSDDGEERNTQDNESSFTLRPLSLALLLGRGKLAKLLLDTGAWVHNGHYDNEGALNKLSPIINAIYCSLMHDTPDMYHLISERNKGGNKKLGQLDLTSTIYFFDSDAKLDDFNVNPVNPATLALYSKNFDALKSLQKRNIKILDDRATPTFPDLFPTLNQWGYSEDDMLSLLELLREPLGDKISVGDIEEGGKARSLRQKMQNLSVTLPIELIQGRGEEIPDFNLKFMIENNHYRLFSQFCYDFVYKKQELREIHTQPGQVALRAAVTKGSPLFVRSLVQFGVSPTEEFRDLTATYSLQKNVASPNFDIPGLGNPRQELISAFDYNHQLLEASHGDDELDRKAISGILYRALSEQEQQQIPADQKPDISETRMDGLIMMGINSERLFFYTRKVVLDNRVRILEGFDRTNNNISEVGENVKELLAADKEKRVILDAIYGSVKHLEQSSGDMAKGLRDFYENQSAANNELRLGLAPIIEDATKAAKVKADQIKIRSNKHLSNYYMSFQLLFNGFINSAVAGKTKGNAIAGATAAVLENLPVPLIGDGLRLFGHMINSANRLYAEQKEKSILDYIENNPAQFADLVEETARFICLKREGFLTEYAMKPPNSVSDVTKDLGDAILEPENIKTGIDYIKKGFSGIFSDAYGAFKDKVKDTLKSRLENARVPEPTPAERRSQKNMAALALEDVKYLIDAIIHHNPPPIMQENSDVDQQRKLRAKAFGHLVIVRQDSKHSEIVEKEQAIIAEIDEKEQTILERRITKIFNNVELEPKRRGSLLRNRKKHGITIAHNVLHSPPTLDDEEGYGVQQFQSESGTVFLALRFSDHKWEDSVKLVQETEVFNIYEIKPKKCKILVEVEQHNFEMVSHLLDSVRGNKIKDGSIKYRTVDKSKRTIVPNRPFDRDVGDVSYIPPLGGNKGRTSRKPSYMEGGMGIDLDAAEQPRLVYEEGVASSGRRVQQGAEADLEANRLQLLPLRSESGEYGFHDFPEEDWLESGAPAPDTRPSSMVTSWTDSQRLRRVSGSARSRGDNIERKRSTGTFTIST